MPSIPLAEFGPIVPSNDFCSPSGVVEVRGYRQCIRELCSALLALWCKAYPFLRTMVRKESEMLWNKESLSPTS